MEMKELVPYMGYLMIFVIAVLVILWGISIYLVKTEKMSVHDWSLRSLGLPQGSVRAILAFIILFLVVIGITYKGAIPNLPDWLVGILGAVVGFYFGAATVPKVPAAQPKPEEGKAEKSEKEKKD